MRAVQIFKSLRNIKLTRRYIALACLYGISTLIIPFASQFLVNNLALTGLWVSSYAFLLIIGVFLAGSLVVKYLQFVLVEYMQRHLFFREVVRWQQKTPAEEIQSPYFFEIIAMLKSFAGVVTDGVDLTLRCFFGGMALLFIHPSFIVLTILFLLSLALLRWLARGTIRSALEESHSKYGLFEAMKSRSMKNNAPLILTYLRRRDHHFSYVRRQALAVYGSVFLLQMTLLGWGIHLIHLNQLSIGNLVSAEIILSGIAISFADLPKLLRSYYEYETSCIKVASLKEDHGQET